MHAWEGLDLVLALWTPLLVAWTTLAAWMLLAPRETPRSPGRRRPASIEPAPTAILHAMLDAADERATAFLGTSLQYPLDADRLERSRSAVELTTLVALLMVREWTGRLDRERLGPHAAPVVEEIRSRATEALVTLLASTQRTELGSGHLQAQQLRTVLSELTADLRRFQQTVRPAGQDPYR